MADQPTFDVAIHLGKILFLTLNLESLKFGFQNQILGYFIQNSLFMS